MDRVGLAKFESVDAYVDDTCLPWQVSAGIEVRIAKIKTSELGCWYLRLLGMKDLDCLHDHWESHNIRAGVRYEF